MDDTLQPPERLALAYAPRAVRDLWRGYLFLEVRLARAARTGSEPMLAQIRLAWWREQLSLPAARRPAGEPLLGLLAAWDTERGALGELVDGWEAREIGEDGGVRLRAARVEALLALGRLAGAGDSHEAIRRAALEWQDGEVPGGAPRLPRAMRPLAVLRSLAAGGEGRAPVLRLLAAMRVGLIGR